MYVSCFPCNIVGRASRKAGANLLVKLYTKLLEAAHPAGSAELCQATLAAQPESPQAGPDVSPGSQAEPSHPGAPNRHSEVS